MPSFKFHGAEPSPGRTVTFQFLVSGGRSTLNYGTNLRGRHMTNQEIEDFAVEYVLGLERAADREPRDPRMTGDPVDIISPLD